MSSPSIIDPVGSHHGDLSYTEPSSLVDKVMQATISTADLVAMPPPEPLVDGLLYRDSTVMTYGPSGSHKTFLGIDVALSVATGEWFLGRQTERGRVVYVVAEGVAGMGSRIEAWCQHHNIDPGDSVQWVKRAINLHDPSWVGAFLDVFEPQEPSLIVFDTLARCSLGADENSARDMGRVVDQLDVIRRRTSATVMVIHHTGKDASSGARGSSALRAAVDTELELSGDADSLVLKVRKQKNAQELPDTSLKVERVAESLVLRRRVANERPTELTPKHRAVLAVLEEVKMPEGVSSTVWMKAALGAGVSERTFYNARSELLQRDLLQVMGSERVRRYAPADPTATGIGNK